MTSEQRKRLTELKSLNKKHLEETERENNVLLRECLTALGEYRIIDDESEIMLISELAVSPCAVRLSHNSKPPLKYDHTYYILWDNFNVPVVECRGREILAHFDDVTAVDFHTYFIDKNNQSEIFCL
ncbi:MAG: hypothetical protein K2N72_03100 [Oscillospiraceae bacterium]|nr:hypothetical protein [Oscillospiraceae bacterium]